MQRLRIDLAYEGTAFSGWARQPGRRTVQETLEVALGTALRLPQPPAVTVAGRTDAGVHARGQVAHVDIETGAGVPPMRWLNALLPPDVRVTGVRVAPTGFDARFSALARRYSYRIADTEPGRHDPIRRRDTLSWPRQLDCVAMHEAAKALLGEHDFAAFCRRREGATTIRRLLEFSWVCGDDNVVQATVRADAFCHSMVRALVGVSISVGEGRREIGWPARVLAAGVRDSAVHVVPPHGLCLEEVSYPPDADLAARAQETRRVRTRALIR